VKQGARGRGRQGQGIDDQRLDEKYRDDQGTPVYAFPLHPLRVLEPLHDLPAFPCQFSGNFNHASAQTYSGQTQRQVGY
jgi:hypothetical protein